MDTTREAARQILYDFWQAAAATLSDSEYTGKLDCRRLHVYPVWSAAIKFSCVLDTLHDWNHGLAKWTLFSPQELISVSLGTLDVSSSIPLWWYLYISGM